MKFFLATITLVASVAFVFPVLTQAQAPSLRGNVQTKVVSSVPGMKIGLLNIVVDSADLDIVGGHDVMLKVELESLEQSSLGIRKYSTSTQFNDCLKEGAQKCHEREIILAQAPLPFSCFAKVQVKQGNRNLTDISRISIPGCRKPSVNSVKPDLLAPSTFTISASSNLSLPITIRGKVSSTERFPTAAYILNSRGEIIWADLKWEEQVILPGRDVTVGFNKQITDKALKLGCKIYLVVNPNSKIEESNLENNDNFLSFGECRDIDENNVDLLPVLEVENDLIKFGVKNIGDVDISSPTVQYQVFDQNSEIIEELLLSPLNGIVEGFGGEALLSRRLRANACQVVLTVDPYWTIANENRVNNQKIIDLCQ